MSARLTDEQFIAAMREAVKVRGEDFVYPEEWRGGAVCQYTVDGEGACIVGKALEIALGEPYLGDNADAFEVLTNVFHLGLAVSLAAQETQGEQDNGEPWGKALAQFEATLVENGYKPAD